MIETELEEEPAADTLNLTGNFHWKLLPCYRVYLNTDRYKQTDLEVADTLHFQF